MKIFKKILPLLFVAYGFGSAALANDYGLPAGIQEGNILHCFNWSAKDIQAELANIAAAGFGSVQISPLQRSDVNQTGTSWHNLYRPYDLAFKSSSFCSEADLQSLCSEAGKYGIKVIVDVVANHVDRTAGYHDTWWDSSDRVRWNGGINYGDRYSITHGQLGDYGDVNSESAEVIARCKAYIEKLKSLGVKGIRWDAAKHIGLPSEGCNFWSTMCSIPGLWHYGEILDNPGPNTSIIKEYAGYMSVTDNQYCNSAARDNGGLPYGYGGAWAVDYGLGEKCVYWAESHDNFANDEWSQNIDQNVIDRAYACFASRRDAACLYLARPNTKGFNNIKTGKGSMAFKNKQVAEVNKFRNAMVGKEDYFTNAGNAVSITRKNGGAVIVMKGSGQISITNGGGFCPAGTYTDKVGGGTFTVTATTITGTVGNTGIAVIYNGQSTPDPDPKPDPDPDPDPDQGEKMWILGNLVSGGWGATPGEGFVMTGNGTKFEAKGVEFATVGTETKCYFNITDYVGASWEELNGGANRYGASVEGESINIGSTVKVVKYANNVNASGCLSWTVAPGKYDIMLDLSSMTLKVVNAGSGTDPEPDPSVLTIVGDYNLAYSGSKKKVYYWGNCTAPAWPGEDMSFVTGSDGKEYGVFKLPEGTTNVIFVTTGDSDKTADLDYKAGFVHNDNGPTTTAVQFRSTSAVNLYTDEAVDGTPIYFTLHGVRTDNPTQGIYIVKRGNKVSKVIL